MTIQKETSEIQILSSTKGDPLGRQEVESLRGIPTPLKPQIRCCSLKYCQGFDTLTNQKFSHLVFLWHPFSADQTLKFF